MKQKTIWQFCLKHGIEPSETTGPELSCILLVVVHADDRKFDLVQLTYCILVSLIELKLTVHSCI